MPPRGIRHPVQPPPRGVDPDSFFHAFNSEQKPQVWYLLDGNKNEYRGSKTPFRLILNISNKLDHFPVYSKMLLGSIQK
jgi:hypothetical protein